MLALIAGDDGFRAGPIPVALAYAGFLLRAAATTDDARDHFERHGADGCLLVVDARSLGACAGSATWSSFLARHRAMRAVIVACEGADPDARAAVGAPHRVLLEDASDPISVVAAARRLSASRRPAGRRVGPPSRWAG